MRICFGLILMGGWRVERLGGRSWFGAFEIARLDLSAHGPKLATAPKAVFSIQVTESGTLYATEYCNIHGLWASSHKIAVS